MTYKIANHLTRWFIEKGFLKQREYELYVYCIDSLLAKVFFYIAILILAIMCNIVLQTIFFFIGFITFRSTAGGYHAENDTNCSLLSWTTYALCMLFVNSSGLLSANCMGCIIVILILFAAVIALGYAPLEHHRKPVSIERKAKMRKCCLEFQIIWAIFCLVLILLKNSLYAVSLALGNSIAAFFLLFAYYKKKGGAFI